MKSLKKSMLAVFCIMVVIFCSCNRNCEPELNLGLEKQQVLLAIHSSIGWAANKDTALLYSVIAKDKDFLEVHPSTRVVHGFNEFRKAEAFWLNPDFKAVRYEIKDLKINISQSGTVAWFYCVLDDINEWKGQPANWENTRWTGVLEKRDGQWRTVQQHFSFATNN